MARRQSVTTTERTLFAHTGLLASSEVRVRLDVELVVAWERLDVRLAREMLDPGVGVGVLSVRARRETR